MSSLVVSLVAACGSSDADTSNMASSGGQSSTGGSGGSAGSGGSPVTGVGGQDPAPATGGQSAGGAGGNGGQGQPLPEGVPEGYTLQVDEAFSSEASLTNILAGNPGGWTFQAQDGGSLEFSGTGYAPPAPVPESMTSFAILASKKFSSFVLDVELLQLNPDMNQPHRDICIVFNAVSETQYFYAHIAATHDERSHNIHLINNGPRTPITETFSTGVDWGVNRWHKFRLVRNASSGAIEVYHDGNLSTPILTANSTTFSNGYIGFGTFQDSGRIRNLKIWAASATEESAAGFFD